ncbi:MAG: hypothetical protein C0599_16290 [Salinivirgaceae bacterium]|nr:MAG: hypothetical protein C0599_16290 [Salinivirgaceae bacterium]
MFYFGFLSSYFPYLLLIAAPLCYYLYGTVIDPEIEIDEEKTIIINAEIGNYLDNLVIHYNDIVQKIGNVSYSNSPKICAKTIIPICTSPPPVKDFFTGSDIWSRPPPQIIM